MSLVLNASATLDWLLPDEQSEWSERLLSVVTIGGAVSPAIYRYEVGNALVNGLRRGRFSREVVGQCLSDLSRLNIAIEPGLSAEQIAPILDLADRYELSFYDASYLDMAARRSLPLATLDQKLRIAAKSHNVRLWESA